MKGFPKIETSRLFLTELRANDIPQIVEYASNEKMAAFTLNLPSPYSEEDAIFWVNLANQGFKNGTNYIFGIRLKSNGHFIGGIGLTVEKRFNRAEVGYWIAEPFWNKGFATEATKAIIKYAFKELASNKITSHYLVGNPASGKVMGNSGMCKEGELKEHVSRDSNYHDVVVYGITKSSWEKQT